MARTFGERFVEEFRRAGGSTGTWPPDAIEVLKNADRRAFIAALGKVSSASAKTLAVAPRDVSLVAGASARIKRLRIAGAGASLAATLEKICAMA